MSGIVIVGGGLAAARVSEQLRRSEYGGAITIVSDEAHLPYDRPPLSKEVLRGELDQVTLLPREFYDRNHIRLILGSAATAVAPEERTVTLADGTVLDYADLVIATGVVPKRIPSLPNLAGLRVLRTLDESLALRAMSGRARRAVIIGGGFIGCEVSASLRRLGSEVVLVETHSAPLGSVLGDRVGGLIARLHRSEGVDLRTDTGVVAIRGSERVEAVQLTDGSEIDADLVVVAVGSRPATDWLAGSGLAIENGVICDGVGRASAPRVWALGDVASWRDSTGSQVRVEHWSNVGEQARILVAAMLGAAPPSAPVVPYFWSDQYDIKVQCLGHPDPGDVVHVVADDGRRFLAYYERGGRLVGVAAGGMPGKVMKARAKIVAGDPIGDVLPAGAMARD